MLRLIRNIQAGHVVLALFLCLAAGCGSSAKGVSVTESSRSEPPRVLSAGEAKQLLTSLPYKYHWRRVNLPDGATDALAGTAIGKHRTKLPFGISFGTNAQAVPVPQSGTRSAYDYAAGGGFVFTDDIIVAGEGANQIHTAAQWREANYMEVEMEEKLCKASTGRPCPP